MKPIKTLTIEDEKIKFNLIRWMPFGEFNYIAVTDFLSNIFVYKDGKLFKAYLNAHAKLITDICWIFAFDNSSEQPYPYFFSSAMDGSLRLWSLTDTFVPVYDYFTSKVTLIFTINIEMDISNSVGTYY